MARTFTGLFILGCAVFCSAMLGAHFLNRRWDRTKFYE
jgi:hypothetical protein